jgi:hypothetical protein
VVITYCIIIHTGSFKELAQLRMSGLYISNGRMSVNGEVGWTLKNAVVAFFKVLKVKW